MLESESLGEQRRLIFENVANGVPIDPKTMPIIWGQQANYLYKELHDYKSGDRKSPIMAPVVADISLADLRQLANYFAAKPWPPTKPTAMHASTTRSKTRRKTSPSRKRSLRARENAEWFGIASSMPSLQNQR